MGVWSVKSDWTECKHFHSFAIYDLVPQEQLGSLLAVCINASVDLFLLIFCLQSVEVVMIYVYESLALVLASVILGTGIGLMIAATLTLQFNLFTELPFHMEFPSGLFASMIVMAFTVAVVGSGLPAYKFLKKSISNVLRRQ